VTADEVRTERLRLGFSQAELARELGVHPQTVSNWECSVQAPPGLLPLAFKYLDLRARLAGAV
jgi:transcriptional regulator with XRE-family HTH domain